MHNVSLIDLLALLGHVLVLIVRLLLRDGLRVDRRKNLILGELLRLEVLAQGRLLIGYTALRLVEGLCGKWDEPGEKMAACGCHFLLHD